MSNIQAAIFTLDKLCANVSSVSGAQAAALLGQLIAVKAALIEVQRESQLKEFGYAHAFDPMVIRHAKQNGDDRMLEAVLDRAREELCLSLAREHGDALIETTIGRQEAVTLSSRVIALPVHPTKRKTVAQILGEMKGCV